MILEINYHDNEALKCIIYILRICMPSIVGFHVSTLCKLETWQVSIKTKALKRVSCKFRVTTVCGSCFCQLSGTTLLYSRQL